MVRKSGYMYLKLVDGFYTVNCRPKELKCVRPSSFIVQMTGILIAQKLSGFEAFECKSLYIETLCWLSIMTVWILHTIVEHPMGDSKSLR